MDVTNKLKSKSLNLKGERWLLIIIFKLDFLKYLIGLRLVTSGRRQGLVGSRRQNQELRSF